MAAPGKTTARGYGSAHQRARAAWEPLIAAGEGWCCAEVCVMASRWIEPGAEWDLGHTPDRAAYRGPEHMRCNRRDGAIRGNARRRSGARIPDALIRRGIWPQSRAW